MSCLRCAQAPLSDAWKTSDGPIPDKIQWYDTPFKDTTNSTRWYCQVRHEPRARLMRESVNKTYWYNRRVEPGRAKTCVFLRKPSSCALFHITSLTVLRRMTVYLGYENPNQKAVVICAKPGCSSSFMPDQLSMPPGSDTFSVHANGDYLGVSS